ncbi:type II toxin-antitoxin system VapC family toxin [Amycolatopsis sp. FBCC-B4732]|uniref:type II toxin-antitoxin system VapC family toxin n=1 Tax=Amycolatopsis sp. FBCC-B4732 TaxID=3079339 RepID=UPI001FF35EC9|nr:type II toxin-antitoxin system VapC family toxin [Amycolatopsis sp. FBCC-B4732]UOX88614.1 type II toxin-antitoxin system VapC family toxin [Amycolatopsis sp. FBCC-B4732]
MTVFYADTSAVVGAYLTDEPDHAELRKLLIDGDHRVLTSELTRLEFASAITAAKRTGRIPDARRFLDQFDEDARTVLGIIPLEPPRIFAAARRLVTENYPVRTLDAIHIAVAMHDTAELTGGEPVTFVTRAERQADAAKANGFEVL